MGWERETGREVLTGKREEWERREMDVEVGGRLLAAGKLPLFKQPSWR